MERIGFVVVIGLLLAGYLTGWLSPAEGVITIGGKEVAVLGSPEAAHEVVNAVKAELTAGYDGLVTITPEVKVKRAHRPSPNIVKPEVARKIVADAVSARGKVAAVLVDGKALMVLPSKEEAERALRVFASMFPGYVAKTTPRFKEKVEIVEREQDLVSLVPDAETAAERMAAGVNRKRYYTVRAGDTLSEIAEEQSIRLQKLQRLNPNIDIHRLSVGMTLVVGTIAPPLTVISNGRIEGEEEIPFESEIKRSSSLYMGRKKVLQVGVPGRRWYRALATYENGEIVSREILEEELLAEPVVEVATIGTKPYPRRLGSPATSGFARGGERMARMVYDQYRRGNRLGRFRGVYGVKELGVSVGTAHSLNHAFGAHYAYELSWSQIVSYLDRGDRSFGGRWGCSGGAHSPAGAAAWIRKKILAK